MGYPWLKSEDRVSKLKLSILDVLVQQEYGVTKRNI